MTIYDKAKSIVLSDYEALDELSYLLRNHNFDSETADIAKDYLGTLERRHICEKLHELHELFIGK